MSVESAPDSTSTPGYLSSTRPTRSESHGKTIFTLDIINNP